MVHQSEKFDHLGIVTHTKTQFIVTSWSRRYNLSRSVYRSLQLEHSENIQGPKKHTPWFQMAWLESQKNSARASGEFCKTRLWHIADLLCQKTDILQHLKNLKWQWKTHVSVPAARSCLWSRWGPSKTSPWAKKSKPGRSNQSLQSSKNGRPIAVDQTIIQSKKHLDQIWQILMKS
jgi:hypothetical protein